MNRMGDKLVDSFQFVPEGQPKIAQRFIAGNVWQSTASPIGTAASNDVAGFSRPYGTCLALTAKPSDKSLGYFRLSLRDIFKSVSASDAEKRTCSS